MELVIDANALLSVLIARGSTPNIIFSGVDWIAPGLLLSELNKYKEEIAKRSSLSIGHVDELLVLVLSEIRIIERAEFDKYLKLVL